MNAHGEGLALDIGIGTGYATSQVFEDRPTVCLDMIASNLQYHNEKVKYFEAIWNVWNWTDVAARFAEAQKSSLNLQFPTGAPVGKRPTSTHQPGRA